MPGSSRRCSNAACSRSPRRRCLHAIASDKHRASLPCSKNAPLWSPHIHHSLTRETGDKDRAWAFLHTPLESAPFDGDNPLYFMLENGLPALREVARLLVREQRTPLGEV